MKSNGFSAKNTIFAGRKSRFMTKRIIFILFAAVLAISLTANSMTGNRLMAIPSGLTQMSDTTARDTSVQMQGTLKQVDVNGKHETQLEESIRKSLGNDLTVPRTKSVSDVIGKKATDYIMHPFAYKARQRERQKQKVEENLKKLDAAKTYEDELTAAINQQLIEDSIAAANKQK